MAAYISSGQQNGWFFTSSSIGVLLAAYICYQLTKAVYTAFFGPLSIIPGPIIRRFTIIPHCISLIQGRQHSEALDLHNKYGPVVLQGPNQVLFLGNERTFKEIYGMRKGGCIPKDPLIYGFTVNGTRNIATAAGSDHTRQRKIFSHAFSDRALKQQEPMIKQYAAKLSQRLAEHAEKGDNVDMLFFYNATTFDVMADLTFGEPLGVLDGSDYLPWIQVIFAGFKNSIYLRAVKHIGRLPTYIINKWLYRSKAVREKIFKTWKYAAERVDARLAREDVTRPDIWSFVLDKGKEYGGLSLGEQHANGSIFMVAGSETTATLLAGVTLYLLQNPSCLRRVQEEIRSSFLTLDDMTMESLARLQYTNAALNEALRLYPPSPVELARCVGPGGVTIGDIFLPENTVLGIPYYATFRSDVNFTDAAEFHPERWLGDSKYANDNLDCVEAFSVGPRNCIGKSLAWFEMRLLLSIVLLPHDLELCPGNEDWTDQFVYGFWEKRPLMVKVSSAA